MTAGARPRPWFPTARRNRSETDAAHGTIDIADRIAAVATAARSARRAASNEWALQDSNL